MQGGRGRPRGFSLIELVIVIVIIGIMAAIAAPRFSRGARGASEAAMDADLSVMRNSIDLFMAEHGGTYPGNHATATFEQQLTQYTNFLGASSPTKVDPFVYGPYVRTIPPLPLGDSQDATGVLIVTSTPTTEDTSGVIGWIYNKQTGEVWANANGYFDH